MSWVFCLCLYKGFFWRLKKGSSRFQWRLSKCSNNSPLSVCEDPLQKFTMLVHFMLERCLHLKLVLLQERSSRMVLGEHDDGSLQRRDRLKHVFLLGIELCKFFRSKRCCHVQSLLVLCNLLVENLDLSVEASAGRCALFNSCGQIIDVRLRICNCFGLLLVVSLAPACHFFIDF